jgi:hypothetical protein
MSDNSERLPPWNVELHLRAPLDGHGIFMWRLVRTEQNGYIAAQGVEPTFIDAQTVATSFAAKHGYTIVSTKTVDERPGSWRVGRSLGRTLYKDDRCVGIVDTPELAKELVDAANAIPGLASEASETVELRRMIAKLSRPNDLDPEHVAAIRKVAEIILGEHDSDVTAKDGIALMKIIRHVEALAALRKAGGAEPYVRMTPAEAWFHRRASAPRSLDASTVKSSPGDPAQKEIDAMLPKLAYEAYRGAFYKSYSWDELTKTEQHAWTLAAAAARLPFGAAPKRWGCHEGEARQAVVQEPRWLGYLDGRDHGQDARGDVQRALKTSKRSRVWIRVRGAGDTMIGRDFVWVLFLNDMRSAHFEDKRPVLRAESRQALVRFVRGELAAEPWQEPTGLPPTEPSTEPSAFPYRVNSQRWFKSFKMGSVLEWMNLPLDGEMEATDETEHFRLVPRVLEEINAIYAVPE